MRSFPIKGMSLFLYTVIILVAIVGSRVVAVTAIVAIIALSAIAIFSIAVAAIFSIPAVAIIVAILLLRHIHSVEYHAGIRQFVFVGQ